MSFEIRPIALEDWPGIGGRIMTIEQACFEPTRRGTAEELIAILHEPGSLGAMAVARDEILGFSLGAPLEFFRTLSWVADDPEFGNRTTLYAADLAVSPLHRGKGVGLALKTDQAERARAAGYRYITGRYRVGLAEGMRRISTRFQARELRYLTNVYSDDLEPKDGVYYRIDLSA